MISSLVIDAWFWKRITPRRGVSRSAESIRIRHSVVPWPLAGETVIHGASVVAIQSSPEAMRIVRVPPWLVYPSAAAAAV
ncbi:MAG: hypothetical protein K2J53_05825, partial [Alistipes sp.]|nr:hypothetical protein [Alistipes sp.]